MVGVTSDLADRVWQHRSKALPGFTARYDVDQLVWFEIHETAPAAIQREKQIKEWKRAWKINPIERDNPRWIDLYPSLSA
jgi:putative endonuclease